jgi:glutamate racemase
VLGCTHYPFVAEQIRRLLGPGVTLIDTATAIAERVAVLWGSSDPPPAAAPGVRLRNTGPTETMRRLLRQCAGLGGVEIEGLRL